MANHCGLAITCLTYLLTPWTRSCFFASDVRVLSARPVVYGTPPVGLFPGFVSYFNLYYSPQLSVSHHDSVLPRVRWVKQWLGGLTATFRFRVVLHNAGKLPRLCLGILQPCADSDWAEHILWTPPCIACLIIWR